jgi:hypothetical protein
MKKIISLIFCLIASSIVFAETYTSRFDGWANDADMWTRLSDGATVTLSNDTEFRNPANTFVINHTVQLISYWNGDTGSNITINSGGRVSIESSGNFRNCVVTIKNGGSLNVTGQIREGTITTEGTGTVTAGGISVDNNKTSTLTGNITVTGNISLDNANLVFGAGSIADITDGVSTSNTSHLTNSGTLNIGASIDLRADSRITNNSTGIINIGDKLKIGVNNNRLTQNYGKIVIENALEFSTGDFNNYDGAELIVKGTGSFLNSNVKLYNAGYANFDGLLKITNATIRNYIPGADIEVVTDPQGHINAKAGIALENDGCVKGGSLDYWGSLTSNNSFAKCNLSSTTKLPIDLLYFRGTSSGHVALLSWATASETDNDYFTLEHSLDGINYTAVALIKGAGTTSEESSYQYAHSGAAQGYNYYRLKQTDFDGSYKYFAPVAVHITGLEAAVYPTLISAGEKVNMQLSDIKEEAGYTVIGQNGTQLAEGTFTAAAELGADIFSYGINQLIITQGGGFIVISIAKQ